jgi:hypothetical protein
MLSRWCNANRVLFVGSPDGPGWFGLSTAGDHGFGIGVIRLGHPRWFGAAAAFAVAAAIAWLAPCFDSLSRMDRVLFGWLAGEPGLVSGKGTPDSPRVIERRELPQAVAPPRVLLVDEDPRHFFESVPPPPSDLMVVLARLRERGFGSAGFGYPLQWEKPDSLALVAMRTEMDRFDRTVIGYVVKDSTAPVPVPPPFLAASVPYASVEGDAAKLPVVNGVVGLAPEFGGDRSWAGFIRIDTEEPDENRDYLLARWSDRVIFSLPLALEIARLGLSPEVDVRVSMDREIALGVRGPRIPIDFRGRVDLPDAESDRVAVPLALPATAVISGDLPQGFVTSEAPLFFTDERLLGDKANRRWAQRLPRLDAAVRQVPQVVSRTTVPAWPLPAVVLLGLALSLGGAWLASAGRLGRRIGVVLVFGVGIAAVLAAMIRHGIGAPMPLAMLGVPVVLLVLTLFLDAVPAVEVVRSPKSSGPAEARAPAKRKPGARRRKS